ncbi:hypothetical protein ColTof4_02145 [Colletotrichum tofieldiae]|nr:hypothetical protein ColTof3_09569 [Colletotrichum tofieldiae]GKT69722.1 hypothetical protein ColTof4_02145 [Colletotrichum tofieldiae]
MDGDDPLDAWKQELGRHPPWMWGFEHFPAWLRDIWHDVGCFLNAWLYVAIFEHFCFRDAFLRMVFLVLVGNHTIVKNRWLFGGLAFAAFGEIEVCKKFGHAVVQSSHAFFIELALIFLVFPLHFWQSPTRPIPEDGYVVAWGVLTSFVCAVADTLDDYYGMRKWHSLAERNPAFLCKSAEPFSLYTTCSHYAALILLIRELDFAFDGYQSDAIEEAEEALETELTTARIWMYRIRFLFWGLLVRLSVNMAFELVSDAAANLQCWYTQDGWKFLGWLPGSLRQLPFRVCFLGLHFVFRYRSVGWVIEQMHMWVYPEEYDEDDEDEDEDDVDWDEDGEDDENTDEENMDELDTDELDTDELDTYEEGTDGADGTEDTDSTNGEKTVHETDDEDEDEDEDEDGPDYLYIHKDDYGYIFELKDNGKFEREAVYTYDDEHDYRYRYRDEFEKLSIHKRATKHGYQASYTYKSSNETWGDVRDQARDAGEQEDEDGIRRETESDQ